MQVEEEIHKEIHGKEDTKFILKELWCKGKCDAHITNKSGDTDAGESWTSQRRY